MIPYGRQDINQKDIDDVITVLNPIYAIEPEKSVKGVIKTSNLEVKYLH